MSPFSIRERQRTLRALQQSTQPFDLLIIGGGITGAAMLRDAALRGLRVLLVEKGDFAQGTSSRSSKLVHGGVRYLEQYEFNLVFESTRERARLWKLAPQLVHPLPFLFPVYSGQRLPLWKLNLGLWLYDLLALFRTPSLHRKLNARESVAAEPQLRSEGLQGSVHYWDAYTDDSLLTLANALDGVQSGGLALTRTECRKIEWSSNSSHPHQVHLFDQLEQKSFTVEARVVSAAVGPWSDRLLVHLGLRPNDSPPLLAPTRGSHIVVPSSRLPVKHAVVLIHPKDGRVLFAIPWDEVTILGTTDLFDQNSADSTAISADEVDYLVQAGNDYFPKAQLQTNDVISTWSGLRPLLAPSKEASASGISRDHHIEWDARGFLLIAGGKLTTHREMAEQALERLYTETAHWTQAWGPGYRATETKTRPLPKLAQFEDHPQEDILGLSSTGPLTASAIRTILQTQIVLSIEDLFVRRTQIFYKDRSNGWDLLERLKPIFLEELEWSEEQWAKERQQYKSYLQTHVWGPLGRPQKN